MKKYLTLGKIIYLHCKEIKTRLNPSLKFLIAIRLYAEGENLEPRFGGAYFYLHFKNKFTGNFTIILI